MTFFFNKTFRLDTAHQQQHNQHDNYQAEAAAGTIAPVFTVTPRWQCADKDEDKEISRISERDIKVSLLWCPIVCL